MSDVIDHMKLMQYVHIWLFQDNGRNIDDMRYPHMAINVLVNYISQSPLT